MDETLKIVAIISGLLAILKGGLDILREYRARTEALSGLWGRRKFRIAAGLTIIGIVIVSSATWLVTARTEHALTVQIWTISDDEKNSLFASKRFTVSRRGGLPEEVFQGVGQWIVGQVGRTDDAELGNIEVSVFIPADLAQDDIEMKTTPSVDIDKYLYVIEGTDKARIELNEQMLGNLDREFYLEFRRIGYSAQGIEVTPGQELNKKLTLTPKAVSIGIEQFSGEKNSFATRLTDFLASNPRLSIKGPAALEILRKSIAEKKAIIATQPAVQMQVRTSLGVDYVISGTYESE